MTRPNMRGVMKCPACSSRGGNDVVDSRVSVPGDSIRRRRKCADCQHRWTTRESAVDTAAQGGVVSASAILFPTHHGLEPRCECCRFWAEGECHRHAPKPHPLGVELVWPRTDRKDTCGEWTEKPLETQLS